MDENFKAIYDKLDKGEKLDEGELWSLALDAYGEGVREVETTFEEPGSWTRGAHTIVQLGDRYWRVDWEQGLTEVQENEFWRQPVEVVPKIVVIPAHEETTWVEKN